MATSTSQFKPKPKSREPFYASSSHWSDITPIPLIEGSPPSANNPTPAPALATIAYSPRYSEAMSYLRAVMAKNEFSPRAVALTEDIISMNPAHYTVWLFRMKCLKELWSEGEEGIRKGVEQELMWLEAVSERNLKNYQIWHHRQTLLSLLQSLPDTEIPFLAHILSFDAKNYHVWTYRQWLCRQFPDPLLKTNIELVETEKLLDEDLRNNSAWSHRYFIVFGAEELDWMEEAQRTSPSGGNRKDLFNKDGAGAGTKLVVDEDIVEREIAYTKAKIEIAPQNPSAWNYLRGVLRRAGIPLAEMKSFCESYVGGEDADLLGEQVQSSHAIEWLAEIYAAAGDSGDVGGDGEGKGRSKGDEKQRAKECLAALAEKWDPIRRKFWEYKAKRLDLV